MPKKLRLEAPEIPGSVNMEKNEENRKIDRINQAEGISSEIRRKLKNTSSGNVSDSDMPPYSALSTQMPKEEKKSKPDEKSSNNMGEPSTERMRSAYEQAKDLYLLQVAIRQQRKAIEEDEKRKQKLEKSSKKVECEFGFIKDSFGNNGCIVSPEQPE